MSCPGRSPSSASRWRKLGGPMSRQLRSSSLPRARRRSPLRGRPTTTRPRKRSTSRRSPPRRHSTSRSSTVRRTGRTRRSSGRAPSPAGRRSYASYAGSRSSSSHLPAPRSPRTPRSSSSSRRWRAARAPPARREDAPAPAPVDQGLLRRRRSRALHGRVGRPYALRRGRSVRHEHARAERRRLRGLVRRRALGGARAPSPHRERVRICARRRRRAAPHWTRDGAGPWKARNDWGALVPARYGRLLEVALEPAPLREP